MLQLPHSMFRFLLTNPSFTLPMVSGPKHSQHDDEYEISTTPKQGQTPFSPPPAAAQVPLSTAGMPPW